MPNNYSMSAKLLQYDMNVYVAGSFILQMSFTNMFVQSSKVAVVKNNHNAK